VDSHIVCSPTETAKIAFLQLVPLLKAFPEYDKVILAPLPRYLWQGCCSDPTHAPNVQEPDHVEVMLGDIEATNRLWRGITFRERLRNVKVCNAGYLLADPGL
jgi:hypothetical protein